MNRQVAAVRFCELRNKDVINICDCKCLGCVTDLIIDMRRGCIEAIIIPGPGKVCGFFGFDEEYIIPLDCIKNIGPDIILVEICEEKCLKSCK